jgi:hypothetical protein
MIHVSDLKVEHFHFWHLFLDVMFVEVRENPHDGQNFMVRVDLFVKRRDRSEIISEQFCACRKRRIRKNDMLALSDGLVSFEEVAEFFFVCGTAEKEVVEHVVVQKFSVAIKGLESVVDV